MKLDGKRAPADLRCDRCGKGYKHGSCLSKHMCVSPMSPGCPLILFDPEHAPRRLCAGRPRGHSNSLPSLSPYSPPTTSPVLLPSSSPLISLVASG
jgi:hypothetical protein